MLDIQEKTQEEIAEDAWEIRDTIREKYRELQNIRGKKKEHQEKRKALQAEIEKLRLRKFELIKQRLHNVLAVIKSHVKFELLPPSKERNKLWAKLGIKQLKAMRKHAEQSIHLGCENITTENVMNTNKIYDNDIVRFDTRIGYDCRIMKVSLDLEYMYHEAMFSLSDMAITMKVNEADDIIAKVLLK